MYIIIKFILQVWCGWKANIKKKMSINKKEAKATGGGPTIYFQKRRSTKFPIIWYKSSK